MRYGELTIDEQALEAALRREYSPRVAERTPSFLDDREALEEEMCAGIERYGQSLTEQKGGGSESVEWDDLLAA